MLSNVPPETYLRVCRGWINDTTRNETRITNVNNNDADFEKISQELDEIRERISQLSDDQLDELQNRYAGVHAVA